MNKKQLIVTWGIPIFILLLSGCAGIKKATKNFFNLLASPSEGRYSYEVDSYDVYQEGYDEGYDEGYSEGYDDGLSGWDFDSDPWGQASTYSDFADVQETYEGGFEEGFRNGYEKGYNEGIEFAQEWNDLVEIWG